jgi:hypothetical protein
MHSRKSCTEWAFSRWVRVANAPMPCAVPHTVMRATIEKDAVAPAGPKRNAAQSRKGSGRHTCAAGTSFTIPVLKTVSVTVASPP